MITILFEATLIGLVNSTRERRGIYFVTVNLLRELMKRGDVNLVLYYHPDLVKTSEQFKKKFEATFPNQKMPLLINELGKWDDQCEINCIFNTWCWTPDFFQDLKIKKFITIYDMIPYMVPGYEDFLNYGNWFAKVTRSINTKDFYITDSFSAKNDILKFFPFVNENKIFPIPLAPNLPNLKPAPADQRISFLRELSLKETDKYIFSLSSLEKRKNLIINIKAFIKFIESNNLTNFYYIIGGEKWNNFHEEIFATARENSSFSKFIKFIGYVPDSKLHYFYSYSEWFTYTSHYEGFGLPPLEAMMCGAPVIVSNTSSLPEVVGDAGILIPYGSINAHVEAYEKIWRNPEFRKSLVAKSLKRGKSFSWNKTVDALLSVIRQNLSKEDFIHSEEIKRRILSHVKKLEIDHCFGKDKTTSTELVLISRELQNLKKSRSWRITKPLRAIAHRCRQLRSFLKTL